MENVYVRVDDAMALREAMRFVTALSDYPILDEDDCSQREWDANHPGTGDCYAEDCSCEIATHECAEWFKAVCRNPESGENEVEGSSEFEIDTEDDTFWCAGPGCNDWQAMTPELWNFYRDNS